MIELYCVEDSAQHPTDIGPLSTTHPPFILQSISLGLGYLICKWDRRQRDLIRTLKSFQALKYSAPAHSPSSVILLPHG